MYRTGTDVERGDLRGALLGGGDRHDAAARAQVGDPAPARQPGLLHDVDQQLGVFLRRVDAVGDDRCIPVVVCSGQRRPFDRVQRLASSGLMPRIGAAKPSPPVLRIAFGHTTSVQISERTARAPRDCRCGPATSFDIEQAAAPPVVAAKDVGSSGSGGRLPGGVGDVGRVLPSRHASLAALIFGPGDAALRLVGFSSS